MILIVESGSTKTEWRYIANPNEAYESFYSDGINPYYQSADEITIAQKSILVELAKKTIQQVFYYGTGITDDAKRDIIRQVIKPFVGEAEITVENDLVAAGISLCGDDAGIACILGTGANSGYFEGGKLKEQIPPLGFWLGDEGSGANLGKRLILAYLHHELPSDLRDAFIKRFGALNRLDIFEHAYQKEFPNRWFATFSKFLFDHRKHPFCYALVEKAFQDFCQLYLVKYETSQTAPIHFTGSVAFYYSDILKRVVSSFGLRVGIISEAPMAGLTLFHKKMI
jgi:N-acetylglucosamine kinase-like BadF-type ATPase